MSPRARTTRRSPAPALHPRVLAALRKVAGDVPAPGACLDWRNSLHFRQPGPCVLCDGTTPLRSHAGEAVHKACAEQWAAAHPAEALRTHRFVSDVQPKGRDDDHA